MDELFPKLLNELEALKVPDRNGVPYTDYIQNIMRPISHMTWFNERDVCEDVYDREVSVMGVKRDDIQICIEDSISSREKMAYKDLLSYLDQREETLNLFFDKLSDTFKAKFKGFVKRQAKVIFSRTLNWIKSNLPEFLAGLVVSAGSMIFGIYELAVNMGEGIMNKSKKTLKELEKEIKKYAEKQSAPIRAVMNAIGSIIGHGGGFIMSHLLAISLTIVGILTLYAGYKFSRPRVKVKFED